jgi:hypothetical protein
MASNRASLWRRLALLCWTVSSIATAQPAPAEPDLYQEALQLLEQGDRLGAIERYNRLLQTLPNHAGAWLDLGLLYCEQGDVGRAHQIFDQVESRFAPPPAIRELIQHYRTVGCVSNPAPIARWLVTISGGHTNNVNHGLRSSEIDLPLIGTSLILDKAYLPRSSATAAIGLNYVRPLKSLPGTQWFVSLTQKHFASVQEYNQSSFLAGLTHQRAIGAWSQESELVATYLSLGGRTHQTGFLGQTGLWMPVTGSGKFRFGAEVAASRWNYPRDPLYTSTIVEGRVAAKWAPSERVLVRVAFGPLLDRAEQSRLGLDRKGYNLTLNGQWAASDTLRLDAGFRQRRQQDEAVYSPLFGEIRRRSTQRQWVAGLQYKSSAAAPGAWRLEWERAQSRDNIPLFPFSSQTLTLSWQYQWDQF